MNEIKSRVLCTSHLSYSRPSHRYFAPVIRQFTEGVVVLLVFHPFLELWNVLVLQIRNILFDHLSRGQWLSMPSVNKSRVSNREYGAIIVVERSCAVKLIVAHLEIHHSLTRLLWAGYILHPCLRSCVEVDILLQSKWFCYTSNSLDVSVISGWKYLRLHALLLLRHVGKDIGGIAVDHLVSMVVFFIYKPRFWVLTCESPNSVAN